MKMKISLTTLVLFYSFLSTADLGFSAKCIQLLAKKFWNLNHQAVETCSYIVKEPQFLCVSSLVNHFDSLSNEALDNCRSYDNMFAAQAINYAAKKFSKMDDDAVTILSKVKNINQLICVQTIVKNYFWVSNKDLAACTKY